MHNRSARQVKAPLPINIWTEVKSDVDCKLCESPGERRYNVPVYRLSVCDLCWQQAQNGWPRPTEPILFAALAKAGLLIPDRNDYGLLPRQYTPPKDYAL